jgi:hypothetical protein
MYRASSFTWRQQHIFSRVWQPSSPLEATKRERGTDVKDGRKTCLILIRLSMNEFILPSSYIRIMRLCICVSVYFIDNDWIICHSVPSSQSSFSSGLVSRPTDASARRSSLFSVLESCSTSSFPPFQTEFSLNWTEFFLSPSLILRTWFTPLCHESVEALLKQLREVKRSG